MWNCVHSSVFRHVSRTAAIRSSSSFASEYLFFLVSHLQLKCKIWISGGKKQNNIRVTKLFAQKKHFIIENIFHLQYLICSDLFHPPSSYHISKLHSETWGGSAVFLPQNIYMQYLNIDVVCVTGCSIISSLCLCISTGGSVSQPAVTNLKAFWRSSLLLLCSL